MRAHATVFVLGLALALTAPAMADEDPATDAPGAAYCKAIAHQCGRACDDTTEPGSVSAAACEARCAVDRAACEARDGLSGVEPWLADKTDKLDRFMQGFDEGFDPDDAPDSVASCGARQETCETQCEQRHPHDDYARSGCDSVCALDRATCEANAGVEAARPFIEREARRLEEFFDGLLGDGEPAPPEPPTWGEPNPDGTVDL
ncbi:hypothetical protein [Rhodospira trueperi]|uniref:Cysteine rich repeat-containing protein n=1 Tax=Rhodospira trueperi TaxID=69960 RepID=A0A1G7BHG6_9PROT|nr:hypothetical protein [Rhodospira trueperi]SDE26561.1 hypothetical protein SAMN05421720_10541 [Rhodospira trueperi]